MNPNQTSTLWFSSRHSLGQDSQKLLTLQSGFLNSNVHHRRVEHGFVSKG